MRVAALLLALAPLAAFAAPSLGQPEGRSHRCSFAGWAIDPDLAGLNVRAGPSASAPIVGRLPPPDRSADAERAFGVGFQVVEARDGWFRIVDAVQWNPDQRGGPPLPSGWVSGRYVDFALQTDKAFAAPDPAAFVVATTWRDSEGDRAFDYRRPSDCRGEWVRLLVTGHDGRERPAWVRGVCGIQETTCDGVVGDPIPYEQVPEY